MVPHALHDGISQVLNLCAAEPRQADAAVTSHEDGVLVSHVVDLWGVGVGVGVGGWGLGGVHKRGCDAEGLEGGVF